MTIRTLFPACCALSLCVGMAADLAKLQSIGPASSFQRTAQGVVIECADRSQVRIDLLAADLVRVRAAFGQALTDHGPSWAIAKTSWPIPKWNLSDSAEFLSLITEELEVRVRRSPLLISFAAPRTHRATTDEHPMAHDPASTTIATIRKLGFDEHIYGLGEKAARLDKRRGSFTMWNTDAYRYKEGTDPLYQSIPFYIAWQDGAAYGFFYDNSFRTHFDFGAATETLTTFVAEGGPMDYYFFQGPSMKKILAGMRT
jgi:alpha-glucosidase